MSVNLTDNEKALVEALKVERKDFVRGTSGFSKGEKITISIARYKMMMRLVFMATGDLH